MKLRLVKLWKSTNEQPERQIFDRYLPEDAPLAESIRLSGHMLFSKR